MYQPTENNSAAVATSSGDIETTLTYVWRIPLWLTILMVCAVIAFATFLYMTERGTASRLMRVTLAMIRASLIGLVLWMLAAWALQSFRTDRPELALLIDVSQSMTIVDTDEPPRSGSTPINRLESIKNKLLGKNSQLLEELNRSYRLKLITVGEQAEIVASGFDQVKAKLESLEANQTTSLLGSSLEQAIDLQRGRPTSAFLLFSDGINTQGTTLTEASLLARSQSLPIYTIGVGSDQADPDIQLADVLVDTSAFVGDVIQIPFRVVAQDSPKQSIKVTLRNSQTGADLATQMVNLDGNSGTQSGRMAFTAERPGQINLQLVAESVENEKQLENNLIERSIDVRDQSIRVLLLQQAPSYEFRFLKSLLERSTQPGAPDKKAFALTSILLEGDPRYADQDSSAERLMPVSLEQFSQYDVVLLGDVNVSLLGASALTSLEQWVSQRGGGLMLIAGSQQNLSALTSSPIAGLMPAEIGPSNSLGLDADNPFRWTLTSLGINSPPLQLEAETQRNLTTWNSLPKHLWFAEIGKLKPGTQVWASHESIRTAEGQPAPLLLAQYVGGGRVVLQGNDETFRWTSFMGQDLHYQRYWNQMIRWLARGKLGTQSGSELLFDRPQYSTGEEIGLTLRTGNRSALDVQAKVEAIVEHENGQRFTVELKRQGDGVGIYRATLPNVAPGSYRAVLTRPTITPPPSAQMNVLAPPGEMSRARSDFDGLKNAAESAYGQFARLDQANSLIELLPKGQPVRLQPLPSRPLWNHWLVCLLFVILISSEWLLRRRCEWM